MQHGALLGFRFDIYRHATRVPGIGEIVAYHVVGVWSCISAPPTRTGRRYMKIWLTATPRRDRQVGDRGDIEPIRIASVMMHVVHQRNAQTFAQRQQGGRSEASVVIFDGQPLACRRPQLFDSSLQASQRRR